VVEAAVTALEPAGSEAAREMRPAALPA